MPIYAYKCDACGHRQDVLQKMSDALLTVCPACGAAAFSKQLTAAGFQLKGSGWYATDFKNGGAKPEAKDAAPADGGEAADAAKSAEAAKPVDKPTDQGGAGKPADAAKSQPTSAPAAAPAPTPTAAKPSAAPAKGA
jgi:putative FmdB family regulatory protein